MKLATYLDELKGVLDDINLNNVENFLNILKLNIKSNRSIYICGNGGSAAISNHWHCDFLNQVSKRSKIKPRFYSLVSNIETLTAFANDDGYENVFLNACKNYLKKGDILIIISSSGNSKNVIKAANYAKKVGSKVLSITGFAGGKIKKLSHNHIHIKSNDYGIIEDTTQILMHYFSKKIKL